MSNSLWPHELQHTRLPCPSLSSRVFSNSCPLSQVMPSNLNVLHCPLLFLPSVFSSIRVFFSELALLHVRFAKILELQHQFLPMSIQGWFLLRLTGLISLQSRGVSSTTVRKHPFFSTLPCLWSNLHPNLTAGKTIALTIWTFVGKVVSLSMSLWAQIQGVKSQVLHKCFFF